MPVDGKSAAKLKLTHDFWGSKRLHLAVQLAKDGEDIPSGKNMSENVWKCRNKINGNGEKKNFCELGFNHSVQ